ncbi:MAG: NAD-dependent epimerase/dehydratase family protein [Myxococcales bacterium]|nr:NAD-dependent epimerase/dehydratase family protein [Myxococcales bacterium]
MKVLVTGGTGFLGSHLVPKLVGAGHSVRLLARSKRHLAEPLELIEGDLRDREAVRRAVAGVEAVYHLAGRVSFRAEDARQLYELHVDCTRELLAELARLKTRPRLILASTSGTIAVSREERIGTEADDYPLTVVGRWPYYLSKIYQEKLSLELCRREEIPLVVLNPSLLLGPGDERLSSTWTVLKFLNREIPAMPRGGLAFVDVRDAAEAFLRALTKGELYGRHLLGVNMPMEEFFSRLERLTGVPAPRLKLPSAMNVLGARLLDRVARARGSEAKLDPMEVEVGEHFFYLDASKAAGELGFAARDPHQTLFDTVQYLLSQMPNPLSREREKARVRVSLPPRPPPPRSS